MNEVKQGNVNLNTKEITLSLQQVSQLLAIFLFLSFFIFIAGYYWGKKNGVIQLSDRLTDETLTDKLNHAFFGMQNDLQACDENAENNILDETEAQGSPITQYPKENIAIQKNVDTAMGTYETANNNESANNDILYYAQLGNYNTLKSARKFAKKLLPFGVKIIEKISISSKKQEKKWYQVITPLYLQKHEVLSFIESIRKEIKLSNAAIVSSISKSKESEIKEIHI